MTVDQLIKITQGKAETYFPAEINGFYAGDFLSRVMGRAPAGCAWLTVMSNVNVAGVAALADVKAVVLCEGAAPDPLLTEKLKGEGISLIKTDLPLFETCVRLGESVG